MAKSLSIVACFLTFASFVVYSVYQHQNKADLPSIEPRNADWLNYRPKLLSQKGLIRYYDFEDELRSFGQFRNRGSHWLGDMQASQTQTPSEASFRLVEGRYPGTKAVQTDYYPIEARSYATGEEGFTVAAWIKHDGPGSVVGGNCPNAGTILALGDGVWAGWKFVLLYPSNVLVFELGRPKPETSVGTFSVTRIPPKTWTHIAATWDRKFIQLYVNGLLCGIVEYDGNYSEVKRFNKLRVGYTGNGLGSVIITCDELTLFNHPLSASETLSLATDGEAIPSEHSQLLLESSKHFIHKEWQVSKNRMEQLTNLLIPYPKASGTLLYRLAEMELAMGNTSEAKIIFSAISRLHFLPANLRCYAKSAEVFSTNGESLYFLNHFPFDRKANTLLYDSHTETTPAYEESMIEYDFLLPVK